MTSVASTRRSQRADGGRRDHQQGRLGRPAADDVVGERSRSSTRRPRFDRPLGPDARGYADRGRRVVVVEDGPTLTHGGMRTAPGSSPPVASGRPGRRTRPAPSARSRDVLRGIRRSNRSCPPWATAPLGSETSRRPSTRWDADLVLRATPIDLTRLLDLNKPIARVRYRAWSRSAARRWLRNHRADRPLAGAAAPVGA